MPSSSSERLNLRAIVGKCIVMKRAQGWVEVCWRPELDEGEDEVGGAGEGIRRPLQAALGLFHSIRHVDDLPGMERDM